MTTKKRKSETLIKTDDDAKKSKRSQIKTRIMESADFLTSAKTYKLIISDGKGKEVTSFECIPKEFSTGSFGWATNGKKFSTSIGGTEVKVQINCNLIVDDSKPVKNTTQPSKKVNKQELSSDTE
ncbi:unnamed protein product [Didymodactylos carnosus]|uniref:Uncharacterized protein n=1 Tax=Didymodactylos carnosus TaxID=1234261 RepID=A0A814RBV8_9BILA|nr:unnamed protein product [Didymodactylos carnosus]CAF1561728.1 unnamed protein product [Didymodactylos carnosus]CAF3895527.1 unnamed protein product [Didymodactylos carnosus]CAF4353679.1 unnamed protein product [Didymodactylos carnosus]